MSFPSMKQLSYQNSVPISDNVITNQISSPDLNSNYLSGESIATNSLGDNIWLFIRVIIIILILTFFGINIFAYLGLITGSVADYLKPLLSSLGYPVVDTAKQTLKTSIDGTKDIVNSVANVTNATLNTVESTIDGNVKNNIDENKNNLMKALNHAEKVDKQNIPEPDESGSSSQMTKTGKSGFCYIGSDRNIRSCVEVGRNDTCMSGDIFPTKDICVNPNLRM